MCPQVTLKFPAHLNLEPCTLETGLFIENKFVEAIGKSTFQAINPTNNRVLGDVSEAESADVDLAAEIAQKTFQSNWGLRTSASRRGALLNELANSMEANKVLLAAIETLNTGKPFKFALEFDVTEAVAHLRYFAGWADKNSGQLIETTEKELVYTVHEPLGVVGLITPWNVPLIMLSMKLGPAIAAGNTVIIKPAEQTPFTTLYVAKLISDIFPPGVIQVLPGFGHKTGDLIVRHPLIDKVSFTGSAAVGKLITARAAEANLKDVTLELGGKSPTIIFEDADLKQAVKWAAYGLSFNAGQMCCAGSRVYVQESIYEEFLAEFIEFVKGLKLGDPFEESTFQGPQISEKQFERVMSYICSAREEGAKCILGGKRFGVEGNFIEPTIFTDTTPEMKIMQEEIFGPVVALNKFRGEDEVIALANNTVYGLTAAIHSKDVHRITRVSRQLKVGTVWVNCHYRLYPQVPFGGYRQSGIGRENGSYVLSHYTAVKTVLLEIQGES